MDKFDGVLLDFDWPKDRLLKETKLILQKLELVSDVDLNEWYSEDLFRSDKTFNSNFKLEEDILNLYSKLKKRSQVNNKVILKNTAGKYVKSIIIEALLLDLQKQGKFFKQIYNSQNKIIVDHNDLLNQSKTEISKIREEKEKNVIAIEKLLDEQKRIRKRIIETINRF